MRFSGEGEGGGFAPGAEENTRRPVGCVSYKGGKDSVREKGRSSLKITGGFAVLHSFYFACFKIHLNWKSALRKKKVIKYTRKNALLISLCFCLSRVSLKMKYRVADNCFENIKLMRKNLIIYSRLKSVTFIFFKNK